MDFYGRTPDELRAMALAWLLAPLAARVGVNPRAQREVTLRGALLSGGIALRVQAGHGVSAEALTAAQQEHFGPDWPDPKAPGVLAAFLGFCPEDGREVVLAVADREGERVVAERVAPDPAWPSHTRVEPEEDWLQRFYARRERVIQARALVVEAQALADAWDAPDARARAEQLLVRAQALRGEP